MLPPACHFAKLSTWGGLERTFANLWGCPAEFRCAVNLDGAVHPQLAAALAGAQVLPYKRAGVLPLPKWPAALRAAAFRRRAESFPRPLLGLMWNLLGFSFPRGVRGLRFVHYEHSSVYKADRSKPKQRYLAGLDGVVSCSHANARLLREYWGYRGPLEVCHNGLTPGSAYAPMGKTLAEGATFRIGAAGRLGPEKGFAPLLLALRMLLDRGHAVQLELAGSGPQHAALLELAAHLKLGDAFRIAGFVGDLGDFYRRQHVICCPSLYESFSLVCAEAAASACPVVACRVGGIPEVVEDMGTGILVPATLPLDALGGAAAPAAELRDWLTLDGTTGTIRELRLPAPEALADALERLLVAPDLYAAMSTRALARARNAFDSGIYRRNIGAALRRFLS